LGDGGREDGEGEFEHSVCAIDWRSGSRHASAASLDLGAGGQMTIQPQTEFFMLGLGYGHPAWAHGLNHGDLAVEREDFVTAELERRLPHHLHVQALSRVVFTNAQGRSRIGRGVFEQLVLGPHAPSGFTSILDVAP
ncbi:MAG: hypothetical protein B7Y78_13790, partial [Caulobacter sp. 35-67-4]